MSNDKALKACRDLYLVQQEIKQVTYKIGDCMARCREDHPNDTHLSLAYEKQPNYDGYAESLITDDEITELLSKGGALECKHCLKAHFLVLKRKYLKHDRGNIRRAITMLGKHAAKGGA